MTLIESVRITPSTASVNEEILVQVIAPGGRPYNNSGPQHISINGIPGSSQWLCFRKPGRKRVMVVARADGASERLVKTFDITPIGVRHDQLVIVAERDPERPTAAKFRVVSPARAERQQARRRGHVTRQGIGGAKLADAQRRSAAQGVGQSHWTYEWDFGDGSGTVTRVAYVGHDFATSLLPTQERHVFTVTVKVLRADRPPHELHQTVSVLNTYAVERRRGVLRPQILSSEPNARLVRGGWRAKLQIRNPEHFRLALTRRRIEACFQDSDRPTAFLKETSTIIDLPANTETPVVLSLAPDEVPHDAVAIIVHLAGTAHGDDRRFSVRLSAAFDVPGRRRRVPMAAPLLLWFQEIADRGLVADRASIVTRDLVALVRQGVITPPRAELPELLPGGLAAAAGATRDTRNKPLIGHTDIGLAAVGERCWPENLPDPVPEDMACQATPQIQLELIPGRFMNARKGDIVISPGDNGFIGGLLRQVNPPQNYSHSGIMTRNFDEITHSTAVPDRLKDHPLQLTDYPLVPDDVPLDGHQPMALKFLWPGAITQRVEDAVEGETLVDPENGKSYHIRAFNPDVSEGPLELIPAQVIKPNPFLETPEIRDRLRKVAAVALNHSGNSHYRFFCYTDPSIAFLDSKVGPPEAGWAEGTWPSVCSSFIWRCALEADVVLESGIAEAGEEISSTDDGLYIYSASERVEAGEWLYTTITQEVEEAIEAQGLLGGVVGSVEDVADNVANQMLNTFASDDSSETAKDSDAWRGTGDALAVSPDNLLSWDPPDATSLYRGAWGDREPLIYRAARTEQVTVHVWKKVTGRGTISGITRIEGYAQDGVRVELNEYQFKTTGVDGVAGGFVLTDVAAGDYVLRASVVKEDAEMPDKFNFLTAAVPVTVVKGETTSVDVALQPPSTRFREVVLDGSLRLIDSEFSAAVDQVNWVDIFSVVHLGPDTNHRQLPINIVTDDSVRGQLLVDLTLQMDDAVRVVLTLRIFEDETDEVLVNDVSKAFTIPAGGGIQWNGMWCTNDGTPPDKLELSWMAITNQLDVS